MSFRKRGDPRPYVLTRQQVELIGMDNLRHIVGEDAVIEIEEKP
jgi:hypothetical protein